MGLVLVSARSGLLAGVDATTRHVLVHALFRIGTVAVTPLFVLKAAVFITLLILIARLLERLLISQILRRIHIAESQRFALSRFITYTLFLGGVFIGLQTLGLNLSSLVVFGGAVGVGVGLGLQNVVSNFVAGIILLIEQPIRIGDRIEVKDTLGDVVRIAARSTWIRTNDNVVIVVPNSEFINNATTNWTANDAKVRISLPVGVGYASNPEEVRDLLLRVARECKDVLADPAPDVIFTGYGDNSIDFELRVWTDTLTHKPTILRSELYFAAFRLFREHRIELPFPQRDLHIRSSDIPLPYTVDEPNTSDRTAEYPRDVDAES